jgi:hypothetical protein
VSLSWTFLWTRWQLAPLDWQAIAIFFTGFSAVIGAVYVAKGQNELKENEIKVSLLGRRLDVIKQLRELEAKASLAGEYSAGDVLILQELIQIAMLIFPKCADELNVIYLEVSRMFGANRRSLRAAELGDVDRRLDFEKQAVELGEVVAMRISLLIQDLIAHASIHLDA